MMKEFRKQVGIIRDKEGNPLYIIDIQDILSEETYLSLKNTAKNNLLIKEQSEKIEKENYKKELSKKINTLASAVDLFIGE